MPSRLKTEGEAMPAESGEKGARPGTNRQEDGVVEGESCIPNLADLRAEGTDAADQPQRATAAAANANPDDGLAVWSVLTRAELNGYAPTVTSRREIRDPRVPRKAILGDVGAAIRL